MWTLRGFLVALRNKLLTIAQLISEINILRKNAKGIMWKISFDEESLGSIQGYSSGSPLLMIIIYHLTRDLEKAKESEMNPISTLRDLGFDSQSALLLELALYGCIFSKKWKRRVMISGIKKRAFLQNLMKAEELWIELVFAATGVPNRNVVREMFLLVQQQALANDELFGEI